MRQQTFGESPTKSNGMLGSDQQAGGNKGGGGPNAGTATLDRRFMDHLLQKYRFSEKEIHVIKRRFDKMAVNGVVRRDRFRNSLGLLGLENATFLSDRIFDCIDEDGNDSVPPRS